MVQILPAEALQPVRERLHLVMIKIPVVENSDISEGCDYRGHYRYIESKNKAAFGITDEILKITALLKCENVGMTAEWE